MTKSLPTYIINLKKRLDRKAHILQEFKAKPEFNIHFENAQEDERAATGLWNTVREIVKKANDLKLDFVILCEDDHCFTDFYNYKILEKAIKEAKKHRINVISGGASWFDTVVQVKDYLFWTNEFTGLQFTVIFKPIYQEILSADLSKFEVADKKISRLSNGIYIIFPFISIQKEFGYSDVTAANNNKGVVTDLFEKGEAKLKALSKVRTFYKNLK